MSKQAGESGPYRVEKSITCNGCKFLNFYRCGCRRNQPPGHLRLLNSCKNADDYIAVLRPPDCDYVRPKPKGEGKPEGDSEPDDRGAQA